MAALQAYLPLGEAETAEDIQEETPEGAGFESGIRTVFQPESSGRCQHGAGHFEF